MGHDDRQPVLAARLRPLTVALHGVSAVLIFVLALLILADVLARGIFNQPISGVPELLRNSIVAVVFLQLPYAILSGGMIRVELLYENLGERFRFLSDIAAVSIGIGLFAILVYASWGPLLESWRIGEFEGEGALRVPVFPVRAIVVFSCALVVLAYLALLLQMIVRGRSLHEPTSSGEEETRR